MIAAIEDGTIKNYEFYCGRLLQRPQLPAEVAAEARRICCRSSRFCAAIEASLYDPGLQYSNPLSTHPNSEGAMVKWSANLLADFYSFGGPGFKSLSRQNR